jgi:cholesterol transport system auxiliary component
VRTPSLRPFVLVVLFFGTAACVSKPAVGSQIFSIDPPPVATKTLAPGALVVSVDRVEIAPEFESRSLTYRTGPHSFERDPYAVLAGPPRELVQALLRATLENTDFVRNVVETGGPLAADILVEAYVTDLEGDFTVNDKPMAVVGMDMVVLNVPLPPEPVASLSRKAYVRRLPLAEKSATAVANAWNQGLTEIVAEFVTDLRAALPPSTAAPKR